MKHRRRSVFWKLLIILTLTGVGLNLLVFAAFKTFFSPNDALREAGQRNLLQYAEYILNDLGDPPDVARARDLSRRLGIDIRTDGAGAAWATDDSLPAIDGLRPERWASRHLPAGVRAGHVERRLFLILERGGQRFAFFTPEGASWEPRWERLAVLLLLLTALLAIGAGAVRHTLRPLRKLDAGVRALAAGKLDYRVSVHRNDELGLLANSFNDMAGRLQEMIRSREQLLYDVSHEFRSPLTRMKVALEFLPDDKTKRRLEEDVRALEAMVSEILETARLQNGTAALPLHKEKLAVGLLFAEIEEEFRERRPGVTVASGAEVVVSADRARLKTVLANLVENAMKYSGDSSQPVELRAQRVPGAVEIAVRDFGQGLPADELERVFEPFYRVDKSRTKETGGFGLGLSLCKRIVEAHGGTIRLDLPPGGGVRAIVGLPESEA